MRYFASVNRAIEREPVEIVEAGENRFLVTVRGRTHEVDAVALAGTVSLISDGESYSVEFEEAGEAVNVLVRDHIVSVDIADERRLRMRAATGKFNVSGRQVILAPMPGKIVRVLAKVGDEVTEGQGLVVVEAMKMENELKSPKAGKVVEISVSEGQAVEGGAKLVVVE